MPTQQEIELQAAAFRRLQQHLMQDRTDVQNIDMMNLAGFCRNCLSKWYKAAADDLGADIDMEHAQERVYGESYGAWKGKYQKEVTPEQIAAFEAANNAG